ncbi:MAG: hypothetical protein HYY16_01640 [Planctomycetes bacterium]|nr:hypothetical protein [Planctomycetota bacterium]
MVARPRLCWSTIEFSYYDFPPAGIYPHGLVRARDIEEIDPYAWPPTIKVKREILFLPGVSEPELRRFAEHNRLPLARRSDPWTLILSPFLDAEFIPEQQEETLRALQAYGLTPRYVRRLRERVRARMLSYNTFVLEWARLGHWDVLTALRAGSPAPAYRRFYRESMRIALRAYRSPVRTLIRQA